MAGIGIGLHYLAVPLLLSAADRAFRISCLMGLLTLQNINTEGENKQAMSQIRESPICKTNLIYVTYSRGPKCALPPVVLISLLPPPHFSERLSRDGTSPSLIITGPDSLHSHPTVITEWDLRARTAEAKQKRVKLHLPPRHLESSMTRGHWPRWIKEEHREGINL